MSLQAGQEGHVGQVLVRVVAVQGHGAQRRREVPQGEGQAGRAAVHHAGIHEGGDGVELLSAPPGPGAGQATGRRAKERHAALDAIARIRGRNLTGRRDRGEGTKKKCYFFLAAF